MTQGDSLLTTNRLEGSENGLNGVTLEVPGDHGGGRPSLTDIEAAFRDDFENRRETVIGNARSLDPTVFSTVAIPVLTTIIGPTPPMTHGMTVATTLELVSSFNIPSHVPSPTSSS